MSAWRKLSAAFVGERVMRKAILTALLLLFGATGRAGADDLGGRFNDDFGEKPPVLSPPAPAAPPAAAPAPDPIVVPKPKLRRPQGVARASTPPAAGAQPLLSSPAPGAAAPPSPAATAIKRSGSIPDDYKVGISWNVMDASWDGMFVTNNGAAPFSVVAIQLNNRKDCELKPYNIEKIQKLISVQQAVKQWGHIAINLFGLPKMEVASILIPELPKDLQSTEIAPEESKIKAGSRIAIFNGTKCDKVVEARVDTDVGSISIKFKRPYTGH
jgi:hypothetical protein